MKLIQADFCGLTILCIGIVSCSTLGAKAESAYFEVSWEDMPNPFIASLYADSNGNCYFRRRYDEGQGDPVQIRRILQRVGSQSEYIDRLISQMNTFQFVQIERDTFDSGLAILQKLLLHALSENANNPELRHREDGWRIRLVVYSDGDIKLVEIEDWGANRYYESFRSLQRVDLFWSRSLEEPVSWLTPDRKINK